MAEFSGPFQIIRTPGPTKLTISPEFIAQMDVADRIALARELLDGTDQVVSRKPMTLSECFEEFSRRAKALDDMEADAQDAGLYDKDSTL